MKFMTPRQYGQLLFKVFFKVRTFLAETEHQKIGIKTKKILQAGIYTFLLLELAFLGVEMFSRWLGFTFDFVRATLGVAGGVVGGSAGVSAVVVAEGVALSIAEVVTWGVAWGVAGGVAGGVALGVAGGVALGVAGGVAVGGAVGGAVGVATVVTEGVAEDVSWVVAGGVAEGVLVGVALGVAGSIVEGVAGGVASIIGFFIVWSRWFYLPFLLIQLFKKARVQKLPFHWDENICAPLPFLKAFLFHVLKENRQEAVDEALFLIYERPPQRKAAQQALEKIAIEEMVQFRSLHDISNLKREFEFLPEYDKEVLPYFFNKGYEEITLFASDAQIALNEFNPSNRLRMLERLASNMREFQKKMDFAKKKIGVPFGRIVSHWLEIIQKEIKQIEADVGLPLPNPFIVGSPINPQSELFVGRRDIIGQIQQEALREGGAGAILFIGSRRTGKTSTLLNLKRYLLTSLKPVFVDCQSFNQVSYFAREVSRYIHLALDHEKEKPQLSNSLDELTEFLQLIQSDLRKGNLHLLLCFDEYERLTEKIVSGEFRGLPDAFRHWIQHLPRTICLFAGAHALNEIEAIDWTDYFINVRTVRISFLDFESALRLVTKPIPRFDLQYESGVETAKQLVRRLGCQPFLLQATMSELVNHINTLHRKTAAQTDIDIAIEKLFDSQSTYFDHIWKTETSDPEKEVLKVIIKGQAVPQESTPAIRSLIRKEVLRKEDDELVFCVPVFREWIMKCQV